ncbi:hypothetical protein F503_01625 [Ophiostoma piceae UAMH 11346]|uniref:Uncharacterized protein n=1 Tax=Ophiostoma piceae (strain UAMH 11346) TaxID=1262450 RepID=S3BNT0_OPHP1|nr:hypothetical protein F503_01625 [Ophiostoma piceae UAMH 11346]
MVSMQRSLSSPVNPLTTHSTPAVTYGVSGSPTPSTPSPPLPLPFLDPASPEQKHVDRNDLRQLRHHHHNHSLLQPASPKSSASARAPVRRSTMHPAHLASSVNSANPGSHGVMTAQSRRGDGSFRRTSTGPLTGLPLPNLMVSSKTTAAAATTATVTATATTAAMMAAASITSVNSAPLVDIDPLDDDANTTTSTTTAPVTTVTTATATTTATSVPSLFTSSPPPSRLSIHQDRPPMIPPKLPLDSPRASPTAVEREEKLVSYSASEASAPVSPADNDADNMPQIKYRQFSPEPLLKDVSQYTNSRFIADAAEPEGTSLNELAHLVRLSKYQERKRSQTRLRLQLNLISTALYARLVRCGEMAHRSLSECFRSDDSEGFANLYMSIHNVRKSCDELRKYALFEPELDSLRSPISSDSLDTTLGLGLGLGDGSGGGSSPLATPNSLGANSYFPGPVSASPFLNDISAEARDTFLSFLTALRNNPDYLATRLCSLSASELSALASFYQGMEPIDSVLPFHNRLSAAARSVTSSASGRSSSINGILGGGMGGIGGGNGPSSIKDASPVQKLLSFQRHDPLSALIHTSFANSAGPDSAEDRRRTEIWATACSRMISEKGAAGEPVLAAVLSAWTSMRAWSGRSNMEWFLMKILEDGAFLLDRAEDQNGTRFNLNEWTTKDQIAGEEFYDRAINDLFDVIDDEDFTGIPEGLIEMGNLILKKLDSKQLVHSTRKWLVSKWLFGNWLLSVIIHPETHGLMAEYHITEYGRQRILKEVALRAQRLVVDLTGSLSSHPNRPPKPVSIPTDIRIHIENILDRFLGAKASRPAARLLPARSITSLRETAEVHPYLVVSPADLVTMVNALFPDRRPRSAYSGSVRSGPGSVSSFSVVSQPMPVTTPRSSTDAYSVISTSVSSANSDATTSVEPLLESQQTGTSSSYRSSPPPQSISGTDHQRRLLNNYEDDGYRLRMAVQDMVQRLGQECVLGAGHPCRERWSVLFMSAGGNSLSTHMNYDPNDDEDDDYEQDDTASSSSGDSDGEGDAQSDDVRKATLDSDYHHLRNSILKLVQDFEIPQTLEDGGDGKAHAFSNRANRQKKYRTKNNKVVTTEATSSPKLPSSPLQSRNPYLRHQEMSPYENHHTTASPTGLERQDTGKARTYTDDDDASESVLITMLTAASSQSRAQSDFLSAHQYWKTIQQLNALPSESLRKNGFAALLNIFSRGPRDSIRRSAAAVEEYEAWLIWLKQSQERTEGVIDTMARRLRALRDKMWYVTDVRNSSPYEMTRNIAVALKTMGTSRKWNAYQRSRQQNKQQRSYLYKTESEIVDLLAAPERHGGPNKLADEQADKTRRWLQNCGIANFCQGEERIHRFSCELSSCIDKLIGENLVDAPVLWSSQLYERDWRILEASAPPLQPLSPASTGRSGRDSGMPRSTARGADLRSTLGHHNNPSVQSFDSGRNSFTRGSAATSTVFSETLDTQDYLSGSLLSALPAMDTSMTFWSPFQQAPPMLTPTSTGGLSHVQSPSASTTNLAMHGSGSFSAFQNIRQRSSFSSARQQQAYSSHSAPAGNNQRPGTSASSVDTVFHQQRVSDEKARFLSELRQTLTSLLLSDLGNLVFARGSETDAWFGNLGQECIERREAIERQREAERKRKSSHRSSLKQSVMDYERRSDSGESHGNDSATASDRTPTGPRHDRPSLVGVGAKLAAGTRGGGSGSNSSSSKDFPFTKAYQRLLRMFCVHPNPYAKMSALFELENLIIASLSSRSTRRRLAQWTRSTNSSPVISHASATNVGETGSSKTAGPTEETAYSASASTNTTTRVRPLEETIDNVKGRRLSMPAIAHGSYSNNNTNNTTSSSTKDAVACILQSLFRDAGIRPKTLFRDLQFIASFVPSSVLDGSDRGKSFWAAGLAALQLKSEVCTTMIEVVDEILGVYTKTAPASLASSSPYLSTYSLTDAARMLTITAKEGDPTSQRELAIFYLSNPELVERTTLPLTRPHDVFKKTIMEKYGGGAKESGSGGGLSGDTANTSSGPGGMSLGEGGGGNAASGTGIYDVRNDPGLMCVAIHWMEAAEQGGDEPARQFLGQNGMARER